MSLGLEGGVCGANVLEGEPRARPRRAPPGPEGAARPGAGPGGRAATPGGRSGASSPSPVGAFQQLPGLSRGPDPEGGHLKGLPGSLPSCIMKRHTQAQRRKPPSPACGLRVLRVRAHTLRAHTRAVAHAFPSFAVRSYLTPQFTRTSVVHLLLLLVTRKRAPGREGTCPPGPSPAPKLHQQLARPLGVHSSPPTAVARSEPARPPGPHPRRAPLGVCALCVCVTDCVWSGCVCVCGGLGGVAPC